MQQLVIIILIQMAVFTGKAFAQEYASNSDYNPTEQPTEEANYEQSYDPGNQYEAAQDYTPEEFYVPEENNEAGRPNIQTPTRQFRVIRVETRTVPLAVKSEPAQQIAKQTLKVKKQNRQIRREPTSKKPRAYAKGNYRKKPSSVKGKRYARDRRNRL